MGPYKYVGYPRRPSRSKSRASNSSVRFPIGRRVSSRIRSSAKFANKVKSKTKTLTKKKLTRDKIKRDGPISDSFFRWPTTMRKVFVSKSDMARSQPSSYVSNAYARLDGQIGYQTPLQSGSPGLFTPSDLSAIFTQIAVPNVTATSVSSGGITTTTTLAVKNPTTQKVWVESVFSELLISNATNDVVHVQLYECVARRDIPDTNYYIPGNAWQTGTTNAGPGTVFIVGNEPFSSPGFTEYWKVEKILDVDLHSGGHHRHKSIIKPKCVLNDTYIQEMASVNANYALGKLTRYTMVVIHGYPLNDNTTKTQVSTAACSVDLVWRKSYTFRVLERSTVQTAYTDNLVKSFGVAGEIMNDLIGAVQAVAIA